MKRTIKVTYTKTVKTTYT